MPFSDAGNIGVASRPKAEVSRLHSDDDEVVAWIGDRDSGAVVVTGGY